MLCDLTLYFGYGVRQNWMKAKLTLIAFLAVNAFLFLVPMMPQLGAMAEAALPSGHLPQACHDLEAREAMVGMSNALPLLGEILLGSLKPRLFGEKQRAVAT